MKNPLKIELISYKYAIRKYKTTTQKFAHEDNTIFYVKMEYQLANKRGTIVFITMQQG